MEEVKKVQFDYKEELLFKKTCGRLRFKERCSGRMPIVGEKSPEVKTGELTKKKYLMS